MTDPRTVELLAARHELISGQCSACWGTRIQRVSLQPAVTRPCPVCEGKGSLWFGISPATCMGLCDREVVEKFGVVAGPQEDSIPG